MAHPTQRDFFNKVKNKFPNKFKDISVVDFGSLDVNGSLKSMFENSSYIGVDIVSGRNVDVISKAHEYKSDSIDIIVSGEMLEHDQFWKESLDNMYSLLKLGGLMAISCGGLNRLEHGTKRTGNIWGTDENYYRNITEKDFYDWVKDKDFMEYEISTYINKFDTYFWGIKY